jgi:hypothetical protein
LRDPEAYDLLGQLFETGLVDEMVMGPADYRKAYRRSSLPSDFYEKPVTLVARYERNQPKKKPTKKLKTRTRRRKKRQRKKRKR